MNLLSLNQSAIEKNKPPTENSCRTLFVPVRLAYAHFPKYTLTPYQQPERTKRFQALEEASRAVRVCACSAVLGVPPAAHLCVPYHIGLSALLSRPPPRLGPGPPARCRRAAERVDVVLGRSSCVFFVINFFF